MKTEVETLTIRGTDGQVEVSRKFETDKEWQLKRNFAYNFINEMNKDRALALMNCYVNRKILGVTYNNKIEKTLDDLENSLSTEIHSTEKTIQKEVISSSNDCNSDKIEM
ncbi:hypothetical protein SNEBB_007528 [Seison nebaliae]|nr:hypothetical protein SNEBB_007528 [Seison nebaliae]